MRCLSTLSEDLDIEFILQHFNLWLFVNEGKINEETELNLIEEPDSSHCLKILSPVKWLSYRFFCTFL